MPLRRRETLEHLVNLCRERRRADGFGQESEPRAFERLLGRQRRANRAEERGPRTDLAEAGERLRPIGIVEAEHGGLGKDVAGAEAARVKRVAFDLGRPSFVALDQQPGDDAAKRHGRRVEQRPARNDFLGLPHVGDDLLGGLPRAGGDAGERHRRAHQLEEGAPRDRIGDRFDLRRELVVQTFAKRGIVRELVERAPPLLAWQPRSRRGNGSRTVPTHVRAWHVRTGRHRWHVEQLVSF